MPKPKPNQVIRHEIALTRPLQDAVEQVAMTKSVDNLVRPAAITGAVVIGGFAVYIGYKSLKSFVGWGSDVFDNLNVSDEVSSAIAVMKGEATEEQVQNAAQMVTDVADAQKVPGILRPFKYFFKLF
jgi:hypothetical protein